MAEPSSDLSAELLLREAAWLRRLAATLVVDGARADDLVQQTLLAALERPPVRVANPRAWLGRVATNLARRIGSADERRGARERASAPDEALPPTDEIVARTAQLHWVVGAVLALAEPYRTVVLLRFYEELKPAAIARRVGAPVETVRTRLKRGLELLRAELIARRGGDALAGLVGLLDPALRRAVRRLALAKSSAATSAVAGGIGMVGALGILGMSTKLKVAAALIVVASGAFTITELMQSPRLPPRDSAVGASRGPAPLAAPVVVDRGALPPPVAASRAAESAAPPEAAPLAPSLVDAATCALTGTVRDGAGNPVANALVVVERSDQRDRRSGSPLLWWCARLDALLAPETGETNGEKAATPRTTTSANGTFRIDGLKPGRVVDVVAVEREKGIGLADGITLADPGRETSVELELRDGVVVRGRVEDETHRAVKRALVVISVWDGEKREQVIAPVQMVHTDDDGIYRSTPIPFRRFSLQCGAEGFVDQFVDDAEVVPEGERDHRHDFTLKEVAGLSGRIVLLDGSPAHLERVSEPLQIAGGTMDPRSAAAGPRYLGEAGTLRRPEDRYELSGHHGRARFVSLWSGNTLLGAADVAESGSGPDLRIDLARLPAPVKLASLELEVVEAKSGAPVTDYSLATEWSVPALFGFEGTRQPQTRTREVHASDGRVTLDGLEPGDWEISVRAEGLAPRVVVMAVDDRSAPTPRTIELAPMLGAITGRVVDEAGRPVAQATVILVDGRGAAALRGDDGRTTCDADGRFRFASAPAGDLLLVASAERTAPAAVPVHAGDDATTLVLRDGVDVTITPKRDGAKSYTTAMVRIRDERGVALIDQDRPGGSKSMGAGYAFPARLAPGSYTVELITPNGRTEPIRFTAAPGAVIEVDVGPPAATRAAGR